MSQTVKAITGIYTGLRYYVIPFFVAFIRLAWNGFEFTTKDQAYARWEICDQCDHYDADRVACGICGCGMSPDVGGWRRMFEKVFYPKEHCPINKWNRLR